MRLSLILLIAIQCNAAIALVNGRQTDGDHCAGAVTAAVVSAMDTTGANFAIASTSDATSQTPGVMTDSKGNSWSALTRRGTAGGGASRLWYAKLTSVGSSHTFTFTAGLASVCVITFSGVDQVTTIDGSDFTGENSSVGATTVQPGNLTPSGANELLVSGNTDFGATHPTINSGFSVGGDILAVGGTNFTAAVGYIIETTATAKNPTWTDAAVSIVSLVATQAAFLPASGIRHKVVSANWLVPNLSTEALLSFGGPAGVVINGVTNATPMVVSTQQAHNLIAGDKIVIMNVCSNTNQSSPANFIRKVKTVIDANHFSITDENGVDIAGTGTWCTGNSISELAGQLVGKVTPYKLVLGPKGWLDGTNGNINRKLRLSTNNGLVSLIVNSNLATVTVSYDLSAAVPPLTSGDKVSIWNSTSNTLSAPLTGSEYTVTVTGIHTFTFPVTLANGDYTLNINCGPGLVPNGTVQNNENCLVISQLAVTNNPYWQNLYPLLTTAPRYKTIYDGSDGSGGNFAINESIASYWSNSCIKFLVDKTNQHLLDACVFGFNHIERMFGVNWQINEGVHHGTEKRDFSSYAIKYAGLVYLLGQDYVTPLQDQIFRDKIYNDRKDSANLCNKVLANYKILATGTAQAGNSTTITLAAGDSAANGFYVNNVIQLVTGSGATTGLVTAYNSTTKVATVSSWDNFNPTTGNTYKIYATISRSGTTITGYNTTFLTDLAIGDSVVGGNYWNISGHIEAESYLNVTPSSDTSIAGVINNSGVTANATPSILEWNKAWKVGDCGLRWNMNYWDGASTAFPTLYPADTFGGGGIGSPGFDIPSSGGNNGYTFVEGITAMALAAIDKDPRAKEDLAEISHTDTNYGRGFGMNSWTGPANSGAFYSFGRQFIDAPIQVKLLQNSIVGLPSLDPCGPWNAGPSLFKMYDVLPDFRGTQGWPMRFGNNTSQNPIAALEGVSWLLDGGQYLCPSGNAAKYFRDWLQIHYPNYTNSLMVDTYWPDVVLSIDHRITSQDHTVQPLQYLFRDTSNAACIATIGDATRCPINVRNDVLISRTSWTDAHAGLLFYGSRTFYGDHDQPEPGTIRYYRDGSLLCGDALQPCGLAEGGGSGDSTISDNIIGFGGGVTFRPGTTDPAVAIITRWADQDHGSFPSNYGDTNSHYSYVFSDLTGAYTTAFNFIYRQVFHLKKSGDEEYIVVQDDIDTANAPTSIQDHVHYAQNGELGSATGEWDEGLTTCTSGCQTVLSQEGGVAPHTNGIVSKYFSPGTFNIVNDGTSYSGSAGHSHRITFHAGSTPFATANGLELVYVHKVSKTIADNTVSATYTSDSNWNYLQLTNAVVISARHGALKSTVNFTASGSGTMQYIIAGLTIGSHAVTVGGVAVSGSPFIVTSGNNTIHFETTAGALVVN